ncbi:MAG: hypothetical protein JWO36_6597 [Myxococcales bacterium]|nr:hypothetical protein [Myxococcales bacterium]
MRRLVRAAIVLVAVWLAVLLVLDYTFAGKQRRGTTERISESLQATATLGDSDLALIRGRLAMQQLSIVRDDVVGHLAITVDEIRCELAPIGLALVDSECRDLAVRGVRLEVSTVALFKLEQHKNKPIRSRHVVIDDAVLTFSPSALVPSLGRVEIKIDHAESGPTVFRTPLSWLLTMNELRAHIDLPAGLTLSLLYNDGKLSAAGSLFGSTPVEVPVTLPVAESAQDAQEEVKQLVQVGTDIAERLVAKRAEDWLRKKLSLH